MKLYYKTDKKITANELNEELGIVIKNFNLHSKDSYYNITHEYVYEFETDMNGIGTLLLDMMNFPLENDFEELLQYFVKANIK